MKSKEHQPCQHSGSFEEYTLPESSPSVLRKMVIQEIREFISGSFDDFRIKIQKSGSELIVTCQKNGGD